MTSRDFCYWLQGFFEIRNSGRDRKDLSASQVEMIERHLAMVFVHEIDPSHGDEKKQKQLNEIHSGKSEKNPGEIAKEKYLANLILTDEQVAHFTKSQYGEWFKYTGPDKRCQNCEGTGRWESPHNGDYLECSCIQKIWITHKEALSAHQRNKLLAALTQGKTCEPVYRC